MEHRAIISKGVGCPINQKTAARSITRSFIRWQDLAQIRFWRAGSESDLQIPHCSENAFYTTIVLAPTIWASISEGFCLVEESAKNPIQPWSPVLITCLKPSPRSNNAWFSDCKSNYENPVNPTQVRPATGGGESKSEAVGFRSVRVFLWRFNSLPLSSVLSAVWTKCQFIFKLC